MTLLSKLPFLCRYSRIVHDVGKRFYTAQPQEKANIFKKMDAWQIHGYKDPLQLTTVRTPIIESPNDVLVQVEAASVNPIDVAMADGYGSELIGLLRKTVNDMQFPLTLGRDFSGKILSHGFCSDSKFQIGQQVWGIVPVHLQGSHAQAVLVPSTSIGIQPASLSPVEATSLMYAGVTAWSALFIWGGLSLRPIRGRRALVLGGAGGVGSIAVQMLRAENAIVFASCSTDAVPLLQSLGVDYVFDYKVPDYEQEVRSHGPYEIILDCAGLGPDIYLKNNWECGAFVTLSSSLLRNTDNYGLLRGLLTSAADFVIPNVQALTRGSTIRWAFFTPLPQAIEYIEDLVKNQKLRPILNETFTFDRVPEAYDKVRNGHLRGKVVIDMMATSQDQTTQKTQEGSNQ